MDLAERTGHPAQRGQSPFAITSGNSFEKRLKERTEYELLAEALRPFVDLPTTGLRVADLNKVNGRIGSPAWISARVDRTDQVLAQLAAPTVDAPHIVDHPMLVFDLAGTPVYLEPDALAFRIGGELELVEIKSYPIIDGQADPAKVSATAGQSAVYLLAMRATLQRLGFSPDLLRWSVILVAPKNFGRNPTAHRVPLRKKAQSIQRVFAAANPTSSILGQLPADFTLDVDPHLRLSPDHVAIRTADALGQLTPLFVPECLSACDLALFCREEAVRRDDPSRLGRSARDLVGNLPHLDDALRLSVLPQDRVPADLADVALTLRMAHDAIERARPTAGVPAASPAPRRRR